MSLAQCKQWAAEHGAVVRVMRVNDTDFMWAIGHERLVSVASGLTDTEAHAWRDMWRHIQTHSDALTTEIAAVAGLNPWRSP